MYCSICREDIDGFLRYGLPPRTGRCPSCGAKPRYRALDFFLREVLASLLPPLPRVLEVGGSRMGAGIAQAFTRARSGHYTAIDRRVLDHHRGAGQTAVNADATRLCFPDGTFDLVLCNNVLTYVRDDLAVMAELARVMRGDAVAMVNTHFESGPTASADDYRHTWPSLDDAYFAENGDCWVYGDDFPSRLESAGLHVLEQQLFESLPSAEAEWFGLRPPHRFILAFRDDSVRERYRLINLDAVAPSRKETR